MKIAPLDHSSLSAAQTLVGEALPFDRAALVAEEKLFGGNGPRTAVNLGAFEGEALVGVVASAGRFVKVLAVDAAFRRRGVGSALLEAVRSNGQKLRVGDHPGNYLSPGVDARYPDAAPFFQRRGFRPLEPVDNLRAPFEGNPLVTDERARTLTVALAKAGYPIRRAQPEDLSALASALPPSQGYELARALAGPRQAVHVALHKNQPIAVAAADGNNQGLGWFGPEWTHPDHRGRGVGRALLIACLLDVRGLPEAGVIAWVGPKEFYAKACAAVDDRRFVAWEEA